MKSVPFLLIAIVTLFAAHEALAKPVAAHAHKSRAAKSKKSKPVPDTGADGGPNLLSHAALVFDPATGRAIYAKNADSPQPIASITKLMTAMVVLEAKQELNETLTIDENDIDTLKSSRSRLPVGTVFQRRDLLRLALVASDNRAAAALGRNYPGGTGAAVEAMNAKAKLLGLKHARFVDPTGLGPDNVASPQDLAILVAEASRFPEIRQYSTTPGLEVSLPHSERTIDFNNTNKLVSTQGWNIGLSKTGYINEAGKCLVMYATIAHNPVVIVLLDSWGRLTRIGDANRIKRWLEKNRATAFSPHKKINI